MVMTLIENITTVSGVFYKTFMSQNMVSVCCEAGVSLHVWNHGATKQKCINSAPNVTPCSDSD